MCIFDDVCNEQFVLGKVSVADMLGYNSIAKDLAALRGKTFSSISLQVFPNFC
jgi:hypothetical protein